MPLVFVHGLGNRVDKQYEEGVEFRDALFRAYLLKLHRTGDGLPSKIKNPLWGDLGGELRWSGQSVPGRLTPDALADAQAAELVEFYLPKLSSVEPWNTSRMDRRDTAVLDAARQSLPDAVDLLWTAAAVRSGEDVAVELADLSDPTYEYAIEHPHPDWLADVHNDDRLVDQLEMEVMGEKRGRHAGWWPVRQGIRFIQDTTDRIAGHIGLSGMDLARKLARDRATRFLGETYSYTFNSRPRLARVQSE